MKLMSNRLTGSKITLLSVIGVLGLALSACAPQSVTASGGSASSTAPQASSEAVANEEVAEDDETASEFSHPAECLLGPWVADNEYFLAAIRAFGDEIKSVEGQVIVEFAEDQTMTTDYRGWLITAVSEGQTVTIERTGIDRGEFEAGEATVDLRDIEVNSALVVSGEGMAMTVESEPVNYASAAYVCDASTAAITTPDGTMQLKRQ